LKKVFVRIEALGLMSIWNRYLVYRKLFGLMIWILISKIRLTYWINRCAILLFDGHRFICKEKKTFYQKQMWLNRCDCVCASVGSIRNEKERFRPCSYENSWERLTKVCLPWCWSNKLLWTRDERKQRTVVTWIHWILKKSFIY